ncbi:FecR family protein [Pedobacter sp. PWIIR3]
MENSEITSLLDRYNKGTATEKEKAIVEEWYLSIPYEAEAPSNKQILESKYKNWEIVESKTLPGKSKAISMWPRVATIAAAVTAIAICIYFFKPTRVPELVSGPQYSNDIAPGKQGATLTLANGKTIKLTDAANGKLAEQSGVTITKTAEGKLIYDIDSLSLRGTKQSQYNTLSTANGETYDLTLPDGTLVSLNAASSLSYPANFSALKERRVKLTGEGYFQVAKDKAHPFIVKTSSQEVEVLGTHFNINSYVDEPSIATTLLEGSVKVTAGNFSQIIKPGEQVINNGKDIKVEKVDTESIIAWKEGDFDLNRVEFKTAMRKIARWYDVEVIYEMPVPDNVKAGGWISRSRKLSAVLKAMESAGSIKFRLEGRKLYVIK